MQYLTTPTKISSYVYSLLKCVACYAHISIDTYIDIPDEVYDIFEAYRKAEQAYQSKMHYHKAYYSLDRDDGIEHRALFVSLLPHEIYERKFTTEVYRILKNIL